MSSPPSDSFRNPPRSGSSSGHSEVALRESADKYRTLFDSIDQGFCIVEVLFDHQRNPVDYRFLEVNAAFEAQTGLDAAAGQRMRSLRPDHEEYWFEIYGRVALDGEPVRFQNEAAALGRWYDVYAFRIGDAEQHRVGILFNDITERRKAEAKHRALEARLASDLRTMRRLHELSTRLVEATDLDTMLEEILDATIDFQGADFGNVQLYDPETRTLSIVVQRGFQQDFLDHFEVVDASDDSACGRALRLRERVIIEDLAADAGFAPHAAVAERAGFRAVQSTPMHGRDGRPLGMLSTHFRRPHRPSERDLHLTDLYLRPAAELISRGRAEEELRRAKEAAVRASEAKSRFLSTISHELRTPLSAVLGFSDLMESEVVGPVNTRQKSYLSRIKAGIRHLVGIIDEILTFTRSEAGKEEVKLAEVNVARIAREVVGILDGEAEALGLDFDLCGDDEPVTALTDGGKVRQILTNLVGNALKYTEEGSVGIELAADDESFELRVHDTGPGIAADRREQIFEPFFQEDSSMTRKHGGTGLGLTICRRQARILGGDVMLSGTSKAGSTFVLRLPRDPESRQSGVR